MDDERNATPDDMSDDRKVLVGIYDAYKDVVQSSDIPTLNDIYSLNHRVYEALKAHFARVESA